MRRGRGAAPGRGVHGLCEVPGLVHAPALRRLSPEPNSANSAANSGDVGGASETAPLVGCFPPVDGGGLDLRKSKDPKERTGRAFSQETNYLLQ